MAQTNPFDLIATADEQDGLLMGQKTGREPDPARFEKIEAPAAGAPEKTAFFDLIGRAEGTDKGRGFNETLAYGKFTGGPVDLENMTVGQVLTMQRRMLAHPENTFNSSAAGRYQVVSKTLSGLVQKGVVGMDDPFDAKTQTKVATALALGRGPDPAALRNEWEGLKNVPDDQIVAAWRASFGDGKGGMVLPALATVSGGKGAQVASDSGAAARFVPMSDEEVAEYQSTLVPDPARYVALSDSEAKAYLVRPKAQPQVEAKAPEPTLSDKAAYIGTSLKAGGYDLLGAGARILDAINPWTLSESDAAVLFKDDPAKLKEFQDKSAAMILSRFAHTMTEAGEKTMKGAPASAQEYYKDKVYATTDTSKAAYLEPTKVIADAVRSLPSMVALAVTTYFTRGAAAQAERQALAEGMTADAARRAAIDAGVKAAAKVGATSEGAIGYGQQAEQTWAEASRVSDEDMARSPVYLDYLRRGFTPEAARAKVIADTAEESGRIAGIVDAAVNHYGGQFLGKIMTEGGSLIPRIMRGAANEAATETVQSGGEQVGQNFATQQNINPDQNLSEGVGEAMAQGGVVGAVSGGTAAGAFGRRHDGVRPAAEPAQQPAPQPDAQPASPPPAPPASGPLNRSLDAAAEQHAGEPRVAATTPDGTTVAGKIAAHGETEDGDLVTSIQGDDGQTYTFSDKDGVQVAPVAPEPSGPISAAIDAAAEEHAADPVAAPEPQPAQPAAPDYDSMPLDELRARLKYIASQAKASGGWNKMFIDARRQVERAINAKVAEAQEASKPSEEPLQTGPFDDRAAANRMMLRHAEATGQPHEVVETNGKFTIQPIKESEHAGADTAGNLPAVGNDAIAGAATAAMEPGDQQAGGARAAQPAQEQPADPGAPAAGTGPAVPGDGAPADAQPALTDEPAKPARDEHAGKWFSTEEKARAYVTKRKIGDTHTVKQTGRVRFEVKPKEEARTTLADAQAKFDRQDEAVRQAAENIAQRKARKEAAQIDAAAHEAATSPSNDTPEPTQVQIESGNYKKGHINVQGLDITVENPRGSTRSGTDQDGKAWSHTMSDHYGYIKRTTGADGEQVDVYVGPQPDAGRVYVVDQLNQEDGSFDEHKAMVGYGSREEAVKAYSSNFDPGWKVGPVKEMSIDEFKSWLKDGNTAKPAAEAAPPAAEPQHQDAGEPAEAATAEVVAASIDKAAKAERAKPSEMRKWLVDQIDKAIAAAPQPDPTIATTPPRTSRGKIEFSGSRGKVGEHGFILVQVRQVGDGNWTVSATNSKGQYERIHTFKAEGTAEARRLTENLLGRAYLDGTQTKIGEARTVTFDVPGDGMFTVPNTPAELAAFKKRVLASPGFKDARAAAKKDAAEASPEAAVAEPASQPQAEQPQPVSPEPAANDAAPEERPAAKRRIAASRSGTLKPEAGKIDDFGEKIGGAKKDVWTGFKDDLNAVADEDIAAQPLSKVWPAPDYQKLIDGGMNAEAVAAVRALRDEVPAKPRAAWKVKRWAEQVKTLRDFANGVMDGKVSPAELREKMLGIGLLRGVAGRMDLYMEVGHAKSLEGIRFQRHHYSIYRGQENVNLWVVEKDAVASAFSNWPREIATGKTREEAIADFKAKYASLDTDKANKQPSFDIFSERGVKAYFIGKKIGRNYAKLAGPFDSVKEARAYRDENAKALEDRLEKFKEIPRERRDVNEPRVGEDMRNGQDVTPQMFGDTFKFRGVEFGNWVEQKRRQQDLNEAFDALMDMAAVLNIPPAAISLNGQLGLAFGARGSGGTNPAAAHYEPGKVVINLTKRSGAGSLGHEWWHALDNYFSRMRGKGDQMMTEALDVSLAARGSEFIDNTPVRKQMIVAFGDVVRAIKQTAIKARSAKLDAKRTKQYWTTGAEMSARAFESYLISKLQDQNASNDYLANIVSEDTWAAAEALGFELDSSYPYPTAGEIPVIRAAFDRFFQTVETREEAGRPVMYSVADDDGGMPVASRSIPDAIVGGPLGDLSKHPDYAAAKAGDMQAAMRSTRDVVTPALVQHVRAMAGDSDPIIQPVAAVEATGRNRIPTAAAERLAEALGLPVGYDIVQSSSPKRTAMAGVDRLFARPRFDGAVEPGRSYILLDDTITQGGTFAALARHIEAGGGHVLGVVALTGKQYSAKIALSDSILNKVRELYGDIEHHFRAAAGHGFDAITESEGRYLANFRPVDAVRNRIVARGQQEGRGAGARNTAGGEGRQASVSGAEPGDQNATADTIRRLMAARSGEATITRDGIGAITIPYGDKESGLAHIAARRGEAFMERLPDLLATGEVYPKDGQPDRIFIGNERDEAVIRTDQDGEPGNWLLTAYEKHPEPRQSRTEEAAPFRRLSDKELKSALTTGPVGSVIARLIEHGTIVIHRSAKTLPKEVTVKSGVQAVTMPDGTMHLVAGSLTQSNARAVLLHEMFHGGVRPMLGEKQWGDLMGRMGSLYRQAEQSSGRARGIYDRARARVATAKAKGAVATRMEVEEFAAYAIEEYEKSPENLPAAIRKWVEDLIGFVKAYIARRYGRQLGKVTPAQLAGFAKMAVLDMAAERRGEMFGPIGELFSVDEAKTVEVDGVRRPIENSKGQLIATEGPAQVAFWKWFGDSAVVGEHGRPEVMYRGLSREYDPRAGMQFWTDSKEAAGEYGTHQGGDDNAHNVVPAYLSVKNPFELTTDEAAYDLADQLGVYWGTDRFYSDILDTSGAQAYLESKGYDGVILDDGTGGMEHRTVVTFSPEQIKSATGNAGTFDAANPDIRYSVAADTETPAATEPVAEPPGLTPPEQGLLRRVQASIQDNMNRVRQVQDRIMELTGRTMLGKSDYYGAETNRPGRIAARLEDARDRLTGPLMEKLAKSGKTPEQLSSLLHAMHAKERNAAVAKINPQHDPASSEYIGTQGSGMNDDVAEEILRQYAGDRELHALAKEARAISRATLDLKLAYGLIKPEDHEALSEMYEFYVPLKGDGEFGPKVKRAMGHTEREEHILENIARDYDQAVVVGEKNLARQSLLRMVLQFKDDDLWTARVPPRGRYVAGKVYNVQHNGKTVATFTSQSQVSAYLEGKGAEAANYTVVDSAGEQVTEFVKPLQDNEVMVYVRGEPVRIQIHDEQLARQLRPLNAGQLHPILEFFRTINQYLSKVYTGYNPAFILRNTARDAMTGTVNILGHEGAAIAAKAWGKYPAALIAMGRWAATRQAPAGKVGQYLTEYRMHGGKVGASYMSDLEQQGKTLQGMFDDARGILATAENGGTLRAGRVAWNKSIGRLAHVVEVANQATENALRLALYITLREEGASAGRAAQSAKQVTVDFDRKGATTGALGSLYLFFNPAIQGSANALKTLARGAHKEQAWAALGGLALAGAWAASKGMGDDKDRWLGEEWSTRARNFIVNVGEHQVRIPLSQEFAPVYALGVALAEGWHGEGKAKTAARVVSSFIDAYFPLSGAYQPDSDNHLMDLTMAGVPTVLKPVSEAAVNRNAFGSQVVPENEFTKDRPDNLKMYRGTKNTPFDKAAQGIASVGELMGAGKYENDITKVSPETLKSLWRTYTGGLGQFVTDSVGLAGMMGAPGQVETGDVPIVKDFVKNQDARQLRSRYYELADEARAAITEFEQAKKAGDSQAALKIMEDHDKARMVGLGRLVRSTGKAAAALGDEKVSVNADPNLSGEQKRAKLKELEQREEALYRAALKVFQ